MKEKKSKLDRYAAAMRQMDDERKTISEIQKWLKAEGCVVSAGLISGYLESLRQRRLQDRLLTQIAGGSRQCAEVEKSFGRNPPPELETLIKLQRVILMQLSTQAAANPAFLELIGNSFKAVLDAEKLKVKREQLSLDREKFIVDADIYFSRLLDKAKELLADNKLSRSERIAELRAAAFKDVAALQTSGKLKIPKA